MGKVIIEFTGAMYADELLALFKKAIGDNSMEDLIYHNGYVIIETIGEIKR